MTAIVMLFEMTLDYNADFARSDHGGGELRTAQVTHA